MADRGGALLSEELGLVKGGGEGRISLGLVPDSTGCIAPIVWNVTMILWLTKDEYFRGYYREKSSLLMRNKFYQFLIILFCGQFWEINA